MYLTAESRTAYSRGFIYNIVTNDTDAVQMTCNQIFSVVSSPLRIIVAMILLYAQLGVAAFAALVLLVAMIPAQVRPCAALVSAVYTAVLARGKPRETVARISGRRTRAGLRRGAGPMVRSVGQSAATS